MKKEVKIGIGLVFLAFYVFLIMQFGKVFVYYLHVESDQGT